MKERDTEECTLCTEISQSSCLICLYLSELKSVCMETQQQTESWNVRPSENLPLLKPNKSSGNKYI